MIHFYQTLSGFLTREHPEFFNKMLSLTPDDGTWVEVGSWLGKSISYCVVESIQRNKNLKFHCVDTWMGSEEHQDMDVIKNNTLFDQFQKNILPINDQIKIHRMPSVEAAKKFEINSIDAIFIDAAHDYESVKADIEAWYPKMKIGSIIGYDDHTPGMVGVRTAVEECHRKFGLGPVTQIGRGAYVVKT